ncbi:MAG: BON domain-containing protein [Bdellovibrionota bacterium]
MRIFLSVIISISMHSFAVAKTGDARKPAQAKEDPSDKVEAPVPQADVGLVPVEGAEYEVQFEDLKAFRKSQFVNLTLGIEQDLKLPTLPDNIEFKGDFRKITNAAISKEMNILKFIPKAEGFATLTIHDKSNGKIVAEYRIDVKKSKLDKIVKEVQALLGDIEGINIKIVNNRVVIDGQILLPKDMSRIYNVANQFGDQVSSLVTLSPLAQKKIAEFIARDINNPEVEVRAVNDKFILQGFVASADERDRAEIIAKTYVPDIIVEAAEEKGVIKRRKPANDGVINLLQIKEGAPAPPKKMVQLVIHFVELKKDYSKNFKFQFTPEIADGTQFTFSSGGSGGGGVVSAITGTISNFLPKLNWAKSHGYARILESTSLIVEDSKKGEIKQVTKQPYTTISSDGKTATAFAEVGIASNITPTITEERSGSVKMDIQFSISAMVGTTSGGQPIVSENMVNTGVTVRDRQSAAIGGLIKNSSSTGFNRTPSNVSNPLISLLASKEFQRDQSQFVVFITPIIKTSASSGSEQIKKKFKLRD